MKYKLKQLNRGIVLAFVLVIGVIVHVNWQKHVFKKDIPVIEKTVNEISDEMLKASFGDPKGFKRRATSAVQNVYTGLSENSDDVWYSKSSLLMQLDNYDGSLEDGTLYDADFEVQEINASKSGSGANVTVYYKLHLTYSGSPEYFDITGIHKLDGKNDNAKRKLEREGMLVLFMRKVDGSWKISSVNQDNEFGESDELVSGEAGDTEEVNGVG